jgi:hypothetical protein
MWEGNSEGWAGKDVEGNNLTCEKFCRQRQGLALLIGFNWVGSVPEDEDRIQASRHCFKKDDGWCQESRSLYTKEEFVWFIYHSHSCVKFSKWVVSQAAILQY